VTTFPALSRNSIFTVMLRGASHSLEMVPPRTAFESDGVNSLNVTRDGSFIMTSLYLIAESTAARAESEYALMIGLMRAAESMFAFTTDAAVRGVFARCPYSLAAESAPFCF